MPPHTPKNLDADPNRPVLRDERGRLLPGTKQVHAGSRKPQGLMRILDELVDFREVTQALVDIAYGKLASRARDADRLKAIELLYDRRYGKAKQSVDVDVSTRSSQTQADVTRASTESLLAARRALLGGSPVIVDVNSEGAARVVGAEET